MTVLFFPSLLLIALFERYIDTPHNRYMRSFFPLESSGEEDDPSVQNPEAAEEDAKNGRHISTVKFEDIVERFPDPNDVSVLARVWLALEADEKQQSMENTILKQIEVLHKKLDDIQRGLGKSNGSS